MASSQFPAALLATALTSYALAGPFPPAAGQPGSDAVAADDTRITFWANAAEITRGPANIASANPVSVAFGEAEDALGPADSTPDEPYTVVSLGDGGSATLTFSTPFGDLPGPDFAVFENGFSASFLELAHIEVSSDGVNFCRFPSTSLTPSSTNLGQGGSVDPTNIRNLAGKHLAGYGTPFDLAEMRSLSPVLDIHRITHIRVIDAVGTNDPVHASHDSTGAIVIDPYPTNFHSGGFDLDAVGVFSATTTTYAGWTAARGWVGNDALPAADPDHNGAPNLIEYLTGNNALQISTAAATLGLTRLAYRTGGNLRVESSPDLIHWSTLAESINAGPLTGSTVITESGDTLKQATISLPAGPAQAFHRLAADLIPSP